MVKRTIEEKVWLKEQFGDEFVYDNMDKEDLLVEFKLKDKKHEIAESKVATIAMVVGFIFGLFVGVGVML